jgi:Lon protease-like protein
VELMTVMPMFPLGTVLFPHTSIPLHVFEERYRVMVRELLGDLHAQFGIVLIERGNEVGGGDVRFNVGCAARILEAEEFPDGRFAIAAIGDARVRVTQWLDDDPYPRAEVEPLAESDATVADFDARNRVVDAFANVVDVARRFDPRIESPPQLDPDPVRASFQAAAWAPIGPLDAQRVLETDEVGERLALLAQLLGERAEELRSRLDDGQG